MPGVPPEHAVVLYDRDCGFCRWSLARVLDLDRRRALRPVPLGSAEADELLAGMSEERRWASAHVVASDGSVYSGAAAVPGVLPNGASLAPVARLLRLPLAAGYGLVVRSRGFLGRRLPDAAKKRATEQIDRHAAEPAAR